jgi:rhodanese-related sulfurtransferase
MKKLVLTVVAVMILGGLATAQGITPEESALVAKSANEFLSGIPVGEYHVLAPDLLTRIKAGKDDFIIVDVRTPKNNTYDQGHLPGAISIGFKDVAKPENLARLPKGKDIIVYCNTGHDENKVVAVLRMLGYQAYGLKWGYMSWKTATPTGMTLKAIEGAIINDYPIEK